MGIKCRGTNVLLSSKACLNMRGRLLQNIFLVFIGAGFGGVFRFLVSNGIHMLCGKNFPYGTLAVNISGCFLMGLLSTFLLEHFNGISPQLRALLLIGVLGGYTTFSSFSLETLNLFGSGNWLYGMINIVANTVISLLALWVGILGGRSL